MESFNDCVSDIDLQDAVLILGNGASIAVSRDFQYENLFKKANLEETDKAIFSKLGTNNFENVLKVLTYVQYINNKLDIESGDELKKFYEGIKQKFIQVVDKIHPKCFKDDHEKLKNKDNLDHIFCNIGNFISKFSAVIDLNYDLILYMGVIDQVKKKNNYNVKDYFIDQKFDFNTAKKEEARSDLTRIFYPHGNLALIRDTWGNEFKVNAGESTLLKSIECTWQSEMAPLFVSEGISEEKEKKILQSPYLQYVYIDILGGFLHQKHNIVIYGWSMSDQDNHIIQQIFSSNNVLKNVFISVLEEDDIHNIEHKIHTYNQSINVKFFKANSDNCWCYE